MIGDEECAPPSTVEEKPKSKNKLAIFALFYNYLERVKRWRLIQNRNQAICKHKYHCFIHILRVGQNNFHSKEKQLFGFQGFLKRFSIGVLIQLVVHFIRSPVQFLKHPLAFFRTLNITTLNLGLFLGLYSGIYRVSVTPIEHSLFGF